LITDTPTRSVVVSKLIRSERRAAIVNGLMAAAGGWGMVCKVRNHMQ
jgi:hypothetical protein